MKPLTATPVYVYENALRAPEVPAEGVTTMAILIGLGVDRPTILVPPATSGDFQGWGVRIG
jgi:hypothetical protein